MYAAALIACIIYNAVKILWKVYVRLYKTRT